MTSDNWMDAIAFNEQGLIPAIAQDKETGKIMMMAWMNRESIELTAQTKTAVYFSRSRQQLWRKGETSGHTQVVHDIFLDCDADALILSITQIGDIACHTGRQSCFYQRLNLEGNTPYWQTIEPVIKNPEDIYQHTTTNSKDFQPSPDSKSAQLSEVLGKDSDAPYSNAPHIANAINATDVLSHLDKVLAERKQAEADSSYVASLYAKGINKILEKVGEESIETIIAAKELAQVMGIDRSQTNLSADENNLELNKLKNDLVYEIADVWFHTLVTLAWFNISSDQVLQELARRFGLSGIDEKATR